MRIILILLLGTVLIVSCSKDRDDDEVQLIGEWKLTAVLADPGDGSGTFKPFESNKIVVFNADGDIASNGVLCSFSPNSQDASTGIYLKETGEILIENCDQESFRTSYKLEANKLIITYLCIEGCAEMYSKN